MVDIICKQRNPYFIDGPAQIGFSGGRSSGYMLKRVLNAHNGKLPEDVYILFENTGKEREETLIFVDECNRNWGINVIYLEYCRIFGRDDLPRYKIVNFETAARKGEPFECMMAYYDALRASKGLMPILPNHSNKMCSAYLKTKAAAWFMRERGYDRWDAVVGIRYDEPRRYHNGMAANNARTERWESYFPMYLDGITKERVNEFWKEQPFDLGIDSDLGNCDICWKKHPLKIMRSIRENPSAVDWWIAQEKRTGQRFRNDGWTYEAFKSSVLDQTAFDFSIPDSGESIDCACTD